MVVEFQVREAIDSLVALLRVAEDSAVHCWEQEEPFKPGIFPGLILLARFAAERAGTEYRLALEVAEKTRRCYAEIDQLQQQLAQVTAERDAARQQHLIECRKYNVEVERRLALEKQVAEVTAERDSLKREWDDLRTKAERKPWMEWQPPANVDKLYKRIPGDAIMVHKLLVGDDLPALYEAGWRYLPITPENELTKKVGELPAETYQWQVGDLVMMGHAELSSGKPRKVSAVHPRGVFLEGYESGHAQAEWERNGWKLYRYRKASDLGVQQLTPRQVEISDSTGTDGEGQP